MNKVILCGRLVRDPDVRYSQGEKTYAIARYTLAVERKFKAEGQPTVDFISCVAMGKNGEFAEKYLHKGTKIIVIGRWQTGDYTNKDGVKVYTNDCMVEEHEFCESKSQNQQSTSNSVPNTNQCGSDFISVPNGSDDSLPWD